MRIRRHALISYSLTIALIDIALDTVFGISRLYAQNAEAESLFSDGNKLMAAGKLAEACATFEASNRIEPRAGTLIRLGECRENNQQLASAWSAFKDARNLAVDPRKRQFAIDRIAALESRLSYLTVTVSNQDQAPGFVLTRNGAVFDPILWNRTLPVDGGEYVIVGRAPGYDAWQKTVQVPWEGAKLSVEVAVLTKTSVSETPTTSTSSKLQEQPTAPLQTLSNEPLPPVPSPTPPSTIERYASGTRQSKRLFTMRRKIAIGVGGSGVIGVVAGSVLGTMAKAKQDDAFTLCPDPARPCKQADQANALIRSSHRQALEANVAFGVAATAVIGAAVLWFTGAPDEGTTRVGVIPSLTSGELNVVFTRRY